MNLTEIQNFLTGLMRGIDRKTALTIVHREDPERPGVIVHLSRDRRSGSLEFSEADLLAGQKDLMQRNRLRTALKRARDRMWEETGYIFSTKMQHAKPEGNSWFRPQQNNRGRR